MGVMTVAQIEERTTPASVLLEKCVFVTLKIECLGNRRKVDIGAVEVDADKSAINVSKELLDSPELEAIKKLHGDARRYLYGLCLPFEAGAHFLPVDLVEMADAKLTEYRERTAELVELLATAYPRLQESAKTTLRGLYDAADYPTVEQVREAFGFSWRYFTLGTPDTLPAEIRAKQERENQDRMAEAWKDVRETLRVAALELVKHLRDRLTPDQDGATKRLSSSTVEKLREFISLEPFKNVTDDQELSAVVRELRAVMDSVPGAAFLRDSETLRGQVRDAMAKAADRLETITGNPRRILLEDE